jgi:DNA-damage-inducible protein D
MSEEKENEEEFGFEDFSHENGITFWWATDFMVMLDYPSINSFMKPIQRAMTACLTANIDVYDNFIKATRVVDGNTIDDYKLSRFACYMVAMNGDVKKQKVAEAQTYFADQAQKINLLLEGSNDLERLLTREEVKEGHKLLNATAKSSGVENFGLFTDAGYRGLYNSGIKNLKHKKGIKQSQSLMDYMGRTELAANLFRITLTEEKLKNLGRIGEKSAINIHKQVGGQVRKLVKDNTGKNPEDLQIERKLSDVTKELKKANKKLNNKK